MQETATRAVERLEQPDVYNEIGHNEWIQTVLEVRLRPGRFALLGIGVASNKSKIR